MRVVAYDIDGDRVARVAKGEMPFMEKDADEELRAVIGAGCLTATTDIRAVARSSNIVIVVGTPVDEFLNLSLTSFRRCIDELLSHIPQGALLVLRSTVFPGTTEWLGRHLENVGLQVDVAMCPERVVEGMALEELVAWPQIIGADTEAARKRARLLFGRLTETLVDVTTREAELAKLLTNAWRYLKFAVANHFFMIADSAGLDYGRILHAIRYRYPRAEDLPGPGFAAGPCLLKDTLQLAAFSQNNFMLGQAAMVVNEGLPAYVVDRLSKRVDLVGRPVGILGMAFKADSDDMRASLSYKLRKLLMQAGARVLCTDPYVRGDDIIALGHVLRDCQLLIIGAPHREYRELDLTGYDVVDIWGVVGRTIDI